MANIPVEKTGTSWLPWLLGLLALALIGFFVFLAADDPDNDDDTVVVDETEAVTPVVTDDLDAVAVEALDLSNLYVTRVVGDRTFFVAPSEAMADQETLVILDQNMSPDAPGIEGQVDINPGQRIAIDGSMEALGDVDLVSMGVPEADASGMTATSQVIRADGGDVDIMDAPMGESDVEVGT